jgi:hypothetical protein
MLHIETADTGSWPDATRTLPSGGAPAAPAAACGAASWVTDTPVTPCTQPAPDLDLRVQLVGNEYEPAGTTADDAISCAYPKAGGACTCFGRVVAIFPVDPAPNDRTGALGPQTQCLVKV